MATVNVMCLSLNKFVNMDYVRKRVVRGVAGAYLDAHIKALSHNLLKLRLSRGWTRYEVLKQIRERYGEGVMSNMALKNVEYGLSIPNLKSVFILSLLYEQPIGLLFKDIQY